MASGMPNQKSSIRVMIVDDSAVIRGMMTRALTENPEIEIVASVVNGKAALNAINVQPVDIVLLDVEMPEMDGITALPLLLEKSPQAQVIMVSNLTQKDADFTLKALQLGASDCIAKPSSRGDKEAADKFFKEIEQKVLILAREGRPSAEAMPALEKAVASASPPKAIQPASTAAVAAPATTVPKASSAIQALAFGSSTGGPQALIQIFRQLRDTRIQVPIFITQHMPATFTKIMANHVQSASGLPCQEAQDGEEVKAGHVYIAPGDYHMVPYRKNLKIYIGLNQEPPVNFCRPAVDPMLDALATVYGKQLLTVILTGMGQDGLNGCKNVHNAKGRILVQDAETSIVWGMPRAVAEANLADAVLPLEKIAAAIGKELS